MKHIAGIARQAGITEFTVELLPDNIPILKVFEKSGLPVEVRLDPEGVHVTLDLS